MLSGHQIRRTFLDFFAANGHRIVRSSSLVPIGDATLLFTNAGMNQFKDVFLGVEQRDYNRATSAQKCVRAGGKHNDLENVGFTNRHHTFFEMLGNFSFGDYFKKEAIAFAMELVTSPKWFGIPLDKLYFTVFGGAEIAPGFTLGADEEAAAFWAGVGAPKGRVLRIPGLKENFWAMGDTGPCGPCSELHYDMGPTASNDGHNDCAVCAANVGVTSKFGTSFSCNSIAMHLGKVAPLPRPHRPQVQASSCIWLPFCKEKASNFDTDLFRPLMDFASKLCGKPYGAAPESGASLRILADHSRASAFLISDGVMPSNEGRGYVLRKIIRRAVRHGRMLGIEGPFLYELAKQVADEMSEPYPELLESIGRVSGVIKHEEERFAHTIDIGLRKLDDDIGPLLEVKKQQPIVSFPGEKAFKLYDTYGLPLDFIVDVLRDQGLQLKESDFDRAMEEQRTRARASWKGAHKEVASPAYAKLAETFRTEPDFYYGTSARDCRIRVHHHRRRQRKRIARRSRRRYCARPHAVLRRIRWADT